MSDPDLFSTPLFRALLRASSLVFAIALVLALLDAGLDVRVPQPLRAAIPWALVASATLAIVLLVGAIGMPKRSEPAATPDEDAASD